MIRVIEFPKPSSLRPGAKGETYRLASLFLKEIMKDLFAITTMKCQAIQEINSQVKEFIKNAYHMKKPAPLEQAVLSLNDLRLVA